MVKEPPASCRWPLTLKPGGSGGGEWRPLGRLLVPGCKPRGFRKLPLRLGRVSGRWRPCVPTSRRQLGDPHGDPGDRGRDGADSFCGSRRVPPYCLWPFRAGAETSFRLTVAYNCPVRPLTVPLASLPRRLLLACCLYILLLLEAFAADINNPNRSGASPGLRLFQVRTQP